MKDSEKDIVQEIKAVADVLSAIDQPINTETINRIGDLIVDLCQSIM